jgi:hypothetical protein
LPPSAIIYFIHFWLFRSEPGGDFTENRAKEDFGYLECFFTPVHTSARLERTFDLCPSKTESWPIKKITLKEFKKGR